MTIICRVAARFTLPDGTFVYEVKPADRNLILTDAPDAIKKTQMYAWLEADGSIETIVTKAQKKRLENDPEAGVAADGKKVQNGAGKAGKAKDGEILTPDAGEAAAAKNEGKDDAE